MKILDIKDYHRYYGSNFSTTSSILPPPLVSTRYSIIIYSYLRVVIRLNHDLHLASIVIDDKGASGLEQKDIDYVEASKLIHLLKTYENIPKITGKLRQQVLEWIS